MDRILVLGPSWVGDMVLAQSLFKVLKQRNPEALIDVAAPAWTLPLLERMPEVNESIALPFKHGQLALVERFSFGKHLRNKGYTHAILLTNSFKSAILPFAARIPVRTGFLGEMRYGLLNDIHPLDKAALPRTVDRFIALGRSSKNISPIIAPNPALAVNHQNALKALQQLGLNAPATKILGLCPGAEYGEAKRWPAEYYAEVAKGALQKGWQIWLFGSEKDVPITSRINKLTGNQCLDLGGKTRLGEVIDLMSLCDTIVSNDSGLMHVAAALGKRLIAIYGSSDPNHTPPMSETATIEYLGLECSPCFKRECPLHDNQDKLKCLKNIRPEKVLQSFMLDR